MINNFLLLHFLSGRRNINMWIQYKGFQITYHEENEKIIVDSAYYNKIQCSYKTTFSSMKELKEFIDNGGWSCK
jgi:hypothetical protein